MRFEDLTVGMKVYIRDDLIAGRIYGGFPFNLFMRKGCCITLDALGKTSFFNNESDYWYTPEMVDWDKTEALNKVEAETFQPPSHYQMPIKGVNAEARDVMKAVMTEEEYRGFLKGNYLKYALRAGKKENEIKDLKKAIDYINWYVEELEGE